jgi:hypothetical protein
MDSTSTNNNFQNMSEPSVSYTSSSNNSGFFDSIKNINATTWFLIILILAFLGFNIFAYLAKGTQTIADIFGPLVNKLFGTAIVVTGEVVDVSAEGAKAVVKGTAGVLESGLTAIQDITPNASQSVIKGQPINQQQPDVTQQSPLNRALNTSQSQEPPQQDYEANEASSSVHSAGKAGWCFVGNDRGFRTCAQVGVNDTCMSGDIFPSQEICMNPNLRS